MRACRVAFSVLAFMATTASTASTQIPTPESVLGFPAGADFELATYEQSLEYFEQLAAASDRVELREVGRTSFGRPWYLALISSAEHLRAAERSAFQDEAVNGLARPLAHEADLSKSTK